MNYEVFDFESEDFKKHSPVKQAWMKAHYNKVISEEEFVAAFQAMKPFTTGKKYKYSPSNLKYYYQRLKTKFGFFQGGL